MINRDTNKFAIKGSNVVIDGFSIPIAKDPITDHGKVSKKGKFVLLEDRTFNVEDTFAMDDVERRNALELVFLDGEIKRTQTIDEIRGLIDRAR